MWTDYAQDGPPLPDWSILERLTPGVAYALLGTIVVVTLLFHFGGVIRERLAARSKPKTVEPVTAEQPAMSAPTSALPQAVDSAATAYDRFIDHLMRQIQEQDEDHDREKAQLALERDQARREASDLRVEVQQLRQMLWQRGTQ